MVSASRLFRLRLACTSAFVLALLATSSAWSQQVSIPDTPAGRVFSAWLDAFNSADRARIAEFDATHDGRFPNGAENLLNSRAQTGGFDLVSIRKSAPPQYIEVIVKERASGREAIGMMEVSNANPPRITNAQTRLIMPGAQVLGYDIDAATRKRVITGAIEKLNELYVFPETAKRMATALRSREKKGEYNKVTNGEQLASLLTRHLQEVSGDKHLRMNFSPVSMPPMVGAPSPEQIAEGRRNMERNNCGFEKVERLPGNVGYVKFNQFGDPAVCGPIATAAMNFIGNVDAVIFDMRDNGGGHPAMVAFVSSYLFDKRTHLNDLWNRKSGQTQEFWTSEDVPGKKLATQPAFVLTSVRTFSGAEEFTYNLKSLKRATIVGETTGGGAHPTSGQRIDERFMLGVPNARAINPITKTNWEGTGVEPDVKVPAADALVTAQKLVAEKLAAMRPRSPGPMMGPAPGSR